MAYCTIKTLVLIRCLLPVNSQILRPWERVDKTLYPNLKESDTVLEKQYKGFVWRGLRHACLHHGDGAKKVDGVYENTREYLPRPMKPITRYRMLNTHNPGLEMSKADQWLFDTRELWYYDFVTSDEQVYGYNQQYNQYAPNPQYTYCFQKCLHDPSCIALNLFRVKQRHGFGWDCKDVKRNTKTVYDKYQGRDKVVTVNSTVRQCTFSSLQGVDRLLLPQYTTISKYGQCAFHNGETNWYDLRRDCEFIKESSNQWCDNCNFKFMDADERSKPEAWSEWVPFKQSSHVGLPMYYTKLFPTKLFQHENDVITKDIAHSTSIRLENGIYLGIIKRLGAEEFTGNPYQYNFACEEYWEMSEGIDECAGNNPCARKNSVCVNTAKSFTCSCQVGYQLWVDRITCMDRNECAERQDLCSQTGQYCVNTIGSFTCKCNLSDGYIIETRKPRKVMIGRHELLLAENESRYRTVAYPKCFQVCQNGGTWDAITRECVCARHWDGVYCTEDFTECTHFQLCLHGGNCIEKSPGYICRCDGTGYSGENCELVQLTTKALQLGVIGSVIAGVVGLLLFIAKTLRDRKAKRKEKKKKAERHKAMEHNHHNYMKVKRRKRDKDDRHSDK